VEQTGGRPPSASVQFTCFIDRLIDRWGQTVFGRGAIAGVLAACPRKSARLRAGWLQASWLGGWWQARWL